MNLPPAILDHLKSEEDLEEAMEQARVLVAAFNNTTIVPPLSATNGATTNSETAPATDTTVIPAQEASDGVSTINATGATVTNAVVPTTTTKTSNTGVPQAAPITNASATSTNAGTTTDTDNGEAQQTPTTNAPTTTAVINTATATNSDDDSAVESAHILDPAAARAERRKTILEEVVQNQPALLAAYLSQQQSVTQSVTDNTTAVVAASTNALTKC